MDYPKFSPKRRKKTMGFGCILVYSWEEIRHQFYSPDSASSPPESQVIFIDNNARPNDPTQYALKLYDHKWEAICAYERQKLAAVHMVAPPVGKFIRVSDRTNKTRYWGYQTCVAIPIERDTSHWHQVYPTKESEWNGPPLLLRLLRNISVQGLPSNDLTYRGMTSPILIRDRGKYYLGGDLHSDNVMLWSDEKGERPVCIDFGYHCVLDSNHGPIRQVYNRSRRWRTQPMINRA
jgi:hypothetical protein